MISLHSYNITHIIFNWTESYWISAKPHCIRSVMKCIKTLLCTLFFYIMYYTSKVLCYQEQIHGKFMLLINIDQWYKKSLFLHFPLNSIIQMGIGNILWDMVSKELYFKPCEKICLLNTLFFALLKIYSAWLAIITSFIVLHEPSQFS